MSEKVLFVKVKIKMVKDTLLTFITIGYCNEWFQDVWRRMNFEKLENESLTITNLHSNKLESEKLDRNLRENRKVQWKLVEGDEIGIIMLSKNYLLRDRENNIYVNISFEISCQKHL